MTTLREAAQAVLDRWDSPAWEWLKQGPTATLMSDLRTALAQEQVKPEQPLRSEFEAWAASYSTFSLERDDDDALGTTGYKSLEQTMLWHAWCAAKTNALEGASEGESGANAQLGLADGDCTHKFAIAPSSGISICTECGLSEFVAQKRAARKRAALTQEQAEPVQEPAAWVDERAISWLASRRNKASAHITTGLSAAKTIERTVPLYTAPPQRKLVPLTEEEITQVLGNVRERLTGGVFLAFARAMERAHGIGGQDE